MHLPQVPNRPGRQVVWVVGLFVLAVALIARFATPNERVTADQNLFHLPVIRQFAAQWPKPDLTNYASATAPGYHLLLAAVARWVSDQIAVLRVCGGLFGVAFIGLAAWSASRRSAWLVLPLAGSVYVLSSTIWLLPENLAWLGVLSVLLLALHASERALLIGGAIVMALLVFVRQSHAWVLLPFAVGVLARPILAISPSVGATPAKQRLSALIEAAALTGLAALPMLAVLAWLVWLWHGLTPPAFRVGTGIELPLATKMGGTAPAAPAMVLSLIGLFGTPLVAWLAPADDRRWRKWLLAGLAVGLFIGALPVSTYSFERRGGILNLLPKLPLFFDRSVLILVLSTIGGGVAAIALLRLPTLERWVFASALVGFAVVQTMNALVWQRYYEPMVLIWLILAAGVPGVPLSRKRRVAAIIGLAGLTLFQIAVTTYGLRGS